MISIKVTGIFLAILVIAGIAIVTADSQSNISQNDSLKMGNSTIKAADNLSFSVGSQNESLKTGSTVTGPAENLSFFATHPQIGSGVSSGGSPSVGTPPSGKLTSISGTTYGVSHDQLIDDYILKYVNQNRMDRGLTPLYYSPNLASSSAYHMNYMITNHYFAHVVPPSEPDVLTRMTNTGLVWGGGSGTLWGEGENIAGGYSTSMSADALASTVVNDWVNNDAGSSWGHRHNILDGLVSDPGHGTGQNLGFNRVGTASGIGTSLYDPISGGYYSGWFMGQDFGTITNPGAYGVFIKPDTIGSYRPYSGFYLDRNPDGIWGGTTYDRFTNWDTAAADRPIAGDWNNNGIVELGVYRPGAGFYLKSDSSNTWSGTDLHPTWDNAPNDLPIAGDWDHDGYTETGVYRPRVGFYLKLDNGNTWTGSDLHPTWDNAPNDLPIAGDWNGDGTVTTGVYRPGAGFYLKNDNGNTWNPSTDIHLTWDNAPNDLPIAGDWNGDGVTETGVYRPGKGYYLEMNRNNAWDSLDKYYSLFDNLATDKPVVGKW